jgi:hypothetical protein
MEMGHAGDRRRGFRAAALISASLALQACVSDTTFLRDGNATPDPQQLETDASGCREIGPLVAGFFGGAAYGALQGSLIGISTGGPGPAAAVGAGVGAIIGLVAGAVVSADGEAFDRCMAEKGYHSAQS